MSEDKPTRATLAGFDGLELRILITALERQVQRWDETWGDAKWRREQNVSTKSDFYRTQFEARERADSLKWAFKAEQSRRKDADQGKQTTK